MARVLVMILIDSEGEPPEDIESSFRQHLYDEYGNGDGIAVYRAEKDFLSDAEEFEISDYLDIMGDDLESMMNEIDKRRAEEDEDN